MNASTSENVSKSFKLWSWSHDIPMFSPITTSDSMRIDRKKRIFDFVGFAYSITKQMQPIYKVTKNNMLQEDHLPETLKALLNADFPSWIFGTAEILRSRTFIQPQHVCSTHLFYLQQVSACSQLSNFSGRKTVPYKHICYGNFGKNEMGKLILKMKAGQNYNTVVRASLWEFLPRNFKIIRI